MTDHRAQGAPATDGDVRGRLTGRSIRSIAIFVALAFALAWLVALPLWFGDGLDSPLFPVIAVAMMITPALAALVMVFFVDRPAKKASVLGVWPLKPARRLIGYSLLGIFVPIVLALIALPIGALLGVFPADFVNFSAFHEVISAQMQALGEDQLPLPLGVLIVLQLATLPAAAFINLIPALGEELGWRGWLLPKLMPLGAVPAILVSGVIWGLWHAPLILLGYNYPGVPGWLGLTAMIGMCVVFGGVFGWLRLRSDSVWPAALAHAAFNGAGGAYLLFAMAGAHVDTTQATVLGWSGWIVPLVLVVILVATGQFRSPSRSRSLGEPVPAGGHAGGRRPGWAGSATCGNCLPLTPEASSAPHDYREYSDYAFDSEEGIVPKVVVFGATGYAGGHIARELVARGHEVVGVARHAATPVEGAQLVAGSVHDTAFVEKVVTGADQVVVAIHAHADDGPRLADALPALAEAALAEGARLSFVGGAGSLRVSEDGPLLFDTPDFPAEYKPEAVAHGAILEWLKGSDERLDWFYVSPAATFGAWNAGERTGSFRIGGDVLLTDGNGDSSISGADYAIAYVDEIENGAHRRQRFSVAY